MRRTFIRCAWKLWPLVVYLYAAAWGERAVVVGLEHPFTWAVLIGPLLAGAYIVAWLYGKKTVLDSLDETSLARVSTVRVHRRRRWVGRGSGRVAFQCRHWRHCGWDLKKLLGPSPTWNHCWRCDAQLFRCLDSLGRLRVLLLDGRWPDRSHDW